jgi:hypothetical protein
MLINFGKFPRSSTHKLIKLHLLLSQSTSIADSHNLGLGEERAVRRRVVLSYIFNA